MCFTCMDISDYMCAVHAEVRKIINVGAGNETPVLCKSVSVSNM